MESPASAIDSEAGRAEAYYSYGPKEMGVQKSLTIKEYIPPDVLAYLNPFWHDFPPESPLFYYTVALIYILGCAVSICGNSLVLYIFMKYSALRSPSNMLVMNLALADLTGMITLVPECVVCFFYGGIWQFGYFRCQLHSFFGALVGGGQIMTLVFIAYDRFNVIVRGFGATPLSYTRVTCMILFVWMFAGFWATGPLIGYGSFALDGILATLMILLLASNGYGSFWFFFTDDMFPLPSLACLSIACSYGYMDQTFTNVAYILGIFIFSYCTPLSIIIICYMYIVKAVFSHEKGMREQAKKMNVASLKTNDDAQKQSAEIRIAKVAMINISLWVIAWTPFAAVCLTGVLTDQKGLTPLVTAIPAFFAKTSTIYNPIIYAISHPKYRQCLKQSLPWMCINEPVKDNQSTASGATKVVEDTA